MLPTELSRELFNIKSPVHDNILEFISDELWLYGIIVTEVTNCDVFIYFDFEKDNIIGELIIDRFNHNFTVNAKIGDETILPVEGDWDKISEFFNIMIMSDK
jgi:hypothetical protein